MVCGRLYSFHEVIGMCSLSCKHQLISCIAKVKCHSNLKGEFLVPRITALMNIYVSQRHTYCIKVAIQMY